MHDVSVVNCVASGSRCAATFSVTLDPTDGSCDMDREQARFFTTLITRYGKVCVMVASPTLTTRRFSYSLTQVRGIASVRPRHKGDSVAIAAYV